MADALAGQYPFDTETLIDICRENDVAMVGVFGSMARFQADEESDIDLLVEFAVDKSLLALVALERKLSNALGRKVDLLTEGAFSPYLRDSILGDLKIIYDARGYQHGLADCCQRSPSVEVGSREDPLCDGVMVQRRPSPIFAWRLGQVDMARLDEENVYLFTPEDVTSVEA